MAQVDPVRLLYLYLTGHSGLAAALGHSPATPRIFGPPLDIPVGMTNAVAWLQFGGQGGPLHPDVPMGRASFSFHCYGPTQSDAQAVWQALASALHRAGNQRVALGAGAVGLLRAATQQSGPVDLPEPELGWARVTGAYSITYCEWTFSG